MSTYCNISFNSQEFPDISLSSNSVVNHHLFILPLYFSSDPSKRIYLSANIALEGAFRSKTAIFNRGTLSSQHIKRHPFFENLGFGAGINLGNNFPTLDKPAFFIEGFFKAHSLTLGLKTNFDNYYLYRSTKPYSIGLSGGIRF